MLVLDKIRLKKPVDLNKTCKLKGFVAFSSSQGEAATVPVDHALVIMFIPLLHSWVQQVQAFSREMLPVALCRPNCSSV